LCDHESVNLRADGQEHALVGCVGSWEHFDVWVDLPNTWLGVTLLARTKQGPLSVEIARLLVSQIEHLTIAGDPSVAVVGVASAARIVGLAMAIRGRPSFGQFEVAAINPVDGEPLSGGNIYVHAWSGGSGLAADRVSRPTVDPYASRSQAVLYTTGAADSLPVGTTVAFAVPADSRAIHITDIEATSLSGGEILRLELHNPTTLLTLQVAAWEIENELVLNLSRPLVGLRGFQWRLVRVAGAGDLKVNLRGFTA
jgi:hypothetical protein